MTPTTANGAGAVLDARVLASVPDAALWRDVLALTKPGIVRMVAVTVAVGFAVRWATMPVGGPLDMGLALVMCLIGAGLSAAGANALNQAIEAPRDAQMRRTRERPVASGRMAPTRGLLLGVLMSFLGVAVLATVSGPAPAAVSAATILLYVCIYTPLKPVTALNTIVGAVPGALPPLIGWAAASVGPWRGMNEPGGWTLFALMFVWQVPHFLAIAWKYREDYARGGHAVLPVVDPSGVRTAWAAMVWALALVPVSLAPVVAMPGRVGLVYVVVATVAGLMFAWSGVRFARTLADREARALFFGSIAYLPVVLITLVADVALTKLL
jgi:protoheme IX farnesyltransferase